MIRIIRRFFNTSAPTGAAPGETGAFQMTRRTMMRSISLTPLFTLTARMQVTEPETASALELFADDIAAICSDSRNASRIVTNYSRAGGALDLKTELQSLFNRFLAQHSEPFSPLTAQRWMKKQIEREYLSGETILIDQWLIARSELTLCALAAAPSRSALLRDLSESGLTGREE